MNLQMTVLETVAPNQIALHPYVAYTLRLSNSNKNPFRWGRGWYYWALSPNPLRHVPPHPLDGDGFDVFEGLSHVAGLR